MNRHGIAVGFGFLGGLIPNDKSNIHPYIMGIIFAVLAVKVLVGDYDSGYQWTISDIYFVILTGFEGILGAASARFLAARLGATL